MLGWELPPNNSGGLGVACLNLSRALAKEGADIHFVVPYESKEDAKQIDFMEVVSALRIDPIFRYGLGAYDTKTIEEKIIPSIDPKKLISIRDIQREYCKFIDEYLEDYTPDVVHAHDWLTYEAGMIAKKKYGLPLIAHVHATEFDRSGMNGGNPLIHAIEYEGLVMADKIIAVSQATKNLIHEKYGIPLDKIDVEYNSLDEDYLNSDYQYDAHQHRYIELMKQQGYKIVSTVGRFTIQKGLSHMLNAAALALEKDKKLLFVFAGDGEEREPLMQQAANLGISENVLFTGFIRGKRLRDIYAMSDIFVMSSVSEPFGLTALEAAHHGDALILTKQSGVAETLRCVMEYDFWDEEKLADEIYAIANCPALLNELQSGIMREYRHLSWDNVARDCIRIYDEVKRRKRNNY